MKKCRMETICVECYHTLTNSIVAALFHCFAFHSILSDPTNRRRRTPIICECCAAMVSKSVLHRHWSTSYDHIFNTRSFNALKLAQVSTKYLGKPGTHHFLSSHFTPPKASPRYTRICKWCRCYRCCRCCRCGLWRRLCQACGCSWRVGCHSPQWCRRRSRGGHVGRHCWRWLCGCWCVWSWCSTRVAASHWGRGCPRGGQRRLRCMVTSRCHKRVHAANVDIMFILYKQAQCTVELARCQCANFEAETIVAVQWQLGRCLWLQVFFEEKPRVSTQPKLTSSSTIVGYKEEASSLTKFYKSKT